MRERGSNGSKLFLTELMIAIFFFAVMVAVCIQLFAEAHTLSIRSKELVQSVNAASNVAEYYTMWDGETESWQKMFPEGSWQGDTWQMALDDEWQQTEEAGSYQVQMELSHGTGVDSAQITVIRDGTDDVLYELTVKRVER